jgi:hypothetical protein
MIAQASRNDLKSRGRNNNAAREEEVEDKWK